MAYYKKRYYKRKKFPKKSGRKKILRGDTLHNTFIQYEKIFLVIFLFIASLSLFGFFSYKGFLSHLMLGVFAVTGTIGLVFLMKVLYRSYKLSDARPINQLRKSDPIDFEHYIANLYRKMGYKTKVTKSSGDMGVDVVCHKDGKLVVIQCKRYASDARIGSPELQQFIGSMNIYGADKGIFIATCTYTNEASKLAYSKSIELIDSDKLTKLINKFLRK